MYIHIIYVLIKNSFMQAKITSTHKQSLSIKINITKTKNAIRRNISLIYSS